MDNPKVSVIVASNRDKPLYEESLKGQDYPNYEIIHISGYVAAKARNIGLKKATGEIIAFIDDDVVLPKEWMSKGVELLKDSDTDIVGGPNIIPPMSSPGERISDFLISSSILNGFRKKFKKHKCREFSNYRNFATCNIMMQRSVFSKIDHFDDRYKYTEDMEFLLRCNMKGLRFLYSPDFFLYHKRRSFPFSHTRQMFFWGYGNMQMAFQYPFVFKRPDIWGSLILWPAFLGMFYFHPRTAVIISIISFPIVVHFLSYALGVITRIVVFLGKRKC